MNYKNKESNFWGGVTLVVLFFIILFIGTRPVGDKEIVPNVEPETLAIDDRLPQGFRDEMMYGCMEEDYRMYDYCLCTIDYLDRNLTNAAVIKIGLDLDETGEASVWLYDAMAVCLDKYNY